MTLTEKVNGFIKRGHLLTEGAHVIVGLSGGADSVALLSLLSSAGYRCTAVHCNFNLRGDEAERDAAHARDIAGRLGVEFIVCNFDTVEYCRSNKVSIEMACRDLRYAKFEALRQDLKAEAIAVGHHMEDNYETMMLNLLRGCGLHGVRAMLPRNGYVVRPLLEVSKSELLGYLSSRGLTYVTDSSNMSNDYKRNRLRNIVTPALLEAFPDAMERIGTSLGNLRSQDALYRSLLPPVGDSLGALRRLPTGVTLLHEWLSPYGFNASQCHDILGARCGAVFLSPEGYRLTLCRDDRFEIDRRDEHFAPPRLTYKVIGREDFKPLQGMLCLDYEAAEGSSVFEVRPWREGDRMIPFGMRGSRLVSDILSDRGVSASARRRCHVLTRNGEILWAIGHRTSALFPVTATTKKIICITYEEDC